MTANKEPRASQGAEPAAVDQLMDGAPGGSRSSKDSNDAAYKSEVVPCPCCGHSLRLNSGKIKALRAWGTISGRCPTCRMPLRIKRNSKNDLILAELETRNDSCPIASGVSLQPPLPPVATSDERDDQFLVGSLSVAASEEVVTSPARAASDGALSLPFKPEPPPSGRADANLPLTIFPAQLVDSAPDDSAAAPEPTPAEESHGNSSVHHDDEESELKRFRKEVRRELRGTLHEVARLKYDFETTLDKWALSLQSKLQLFDQELSDKLKALDAQIQSAGKIRKDLIKQFNSHATALNQINLNLRNLVTSFKQRHQALNQAVAGMQAPQTTANGAQDRPFTEEALTKLTAALRSDLLSPEYFAEMVDCYQRGLTNQPAEQQNLKLAGSATRGDSIPAESPTLAANPTLALEHYFQGIDAYQNGAMDQALQQFERAAHHDSDNPVYRYYLGLTLRRLGRHIEANEQAYIGKQLHAAYPGYNVGAALEQVQRDDRLWLERL